MKIESDIVLEVNNCSIQQSDSYSTKHARTLIRGDLICDRAS